MPFEKFESVLGYHCSPVLMGLKPSNLVSFSKEKMPELPELLKIYREKFKSEGIHLEMICGCRKHFLVLVYRPDMLMEYLKQEKVQSLLFMDGYPIDGNLEDWIGFLKKESGESSGISA